MPFKLPSLPTIPSGVSDKFSHLIKEKGALVALQFLCPIDIHFQLLANMIYKGKTHDITVLYSVKGNNPLAQDPKDIEGFLLQILGQQGSNAQITVDKVKYEGLEYFAIFVDRPEK